MITVILITGKVLTYNGELSVQTGGDGLVRIYDKKGYIVAYFPTMNVERLECVRPCKIEREPRDLRRRPVRKY